MRWRIRIRWTNWARVLACGALFLLLTHKGRFAALNYNIVFTSELVHRARGDNVCNLSLTSSVEDHSVESHEYLARRWAVHPGGSWHPRDCSSAYGSVLLIVPYRDRPHHLDTFLRMMHPFLKAQNLDYKMVVVEQGDSLPFNRAKLFNVGFAEEAEHCGGDKDCCLIFHDVDLIPADGRNIYACTASPRHMSANLDSFRYNLMYEELFGGAVALHAAIFVRVNGFSNEFFGWGGEDDDFSQNRLRLHGFDIVRFDPSISRYRMLKHEQEKKNPQNDVLLVRQSENVDEDGLNTIKYKVTLKEKLPLFTRIVVEL